MEMFLLKEYHLTSFYTCRHIVIRSITENPWIHKIAYIETFARQQMEALHFA